MNKKVDTDYPFFGCTKKTLTSLLSQGCIVIPHWHFVNIVHMLFLFKFWHFKQNTCKTKVRTEKYTRFFSASTCKIPIQIISQANISRKIPENISHVKLKYISQTWNILVQISVLNCFCFQFFWCKQFVSYTISKISQIITNKKRRT